MKTRIIHTKIWEDEYFYGLDDKEQLAFLYLLTNDKINLSGIYELNDANMVMWLRTTSDKIQQIKQKFQGDGKFFFYQGWVKVANYHKYNSYTGGLNDKAKEKEINLVPAKVLENFDTLSIQYPYPMDTSNNKKSEIRNKKSEIINQYIGLFNELTSKNFQVTETRQVKLNARMKTFTYEQIEKSLRCMLSNPFYRGKNDRNWEATPEWLLANDERIDRFLNSKSPHSSLNPL